MFLSPPLYAADLPERLWPGTFDIIGMERNKNFFCSGYNVVKGESILHFPCDNRPYDKM